MRLKGGLVLVAWLLLVAAALQSALAHDHDFVNPLDLEVIRTKVEVRDEAIRQLLIANRELELSMVFAYQRKGVDRLSWDIDLETGAFIPYREGRAPNIPPTFRE